MVERTEGSNSYDVIVAGGGMVGSLLAAALADRPKLSVCVLEAEPPEPFEPGSEPAYDIRVSALSVASQRMFEHVGAWQGILSRRACPFSEMLVWDGETELARGRHLGERSSAGRRARMVAEGASFIAGLMVPRAVGAGARLVAHGVEERLERSAEARDGRRGRTRFDAADIGVDALGHIVENRVIQLALLERLERAPNVELRSPARLASFHETHASVGANGARSDAGDAAIRGDSGDSGGRAARAGRGDRTGEARDGVAVELESGETLYAKLLVGADGARSSVRGIAGIAMERAPYDQRALVATVDTELAQQSITWQRFMPSGPQAFLPLVGHHASMVWYHTDEEIDRLSSLEDDEFLRAMETAFPPELGRLTGVSQRASFPIAKAHAQTYLGRRVALIGDAAHTVHPLAGQGVNLGMLDAGALAETLIDALDAGRDIGSRATLRRYERWRRGENAFMIEVLDGFHHAFRTQPDPLRKLRSLALDLADHGGPAKRLVTRYAMGTAGDLPAIAR